MPAYKVFAGWIAKGQHPAGSKGQVWVVVAATSQRAAAEALGCSPSHVKNYMSRTGNHGDIAQALSAPGTVFCTTMTRTTPRRWWLLDGTEVPTVETADA